MDQVPSAFAESVAVLIPRIKHLNNIDVLPSPFKAVFQKYQERLRVLCITLHCSEDGVIQRLSSVSRTEQHFNLSVDHEPNLNKLFQDRFARLQEIRIYASESESEPKISERHLKQILPPVAENFYAYVGLLIIADIKNEEILKCIMDSFGHCSGIDRLEIYKSGPLFDCFHVFNKVNALMMDQGSIPEEILCKAIKNGCIKTVCFIDRQPISLNLVKAAFNRWKETNEKFRITGGTGFTASEVMSLSSRATFKRIYQLFRVRVEMVRFTSPRADSDFVCQMEPSGFCMLKTVKKPSSRLLNTIFNSVFDARVLLFLVVSCLLSCFFCFLSYIE